MAHIFKLPEEGNKGIIVFTHKEWPWLLQNAQSVLLDLRKYFFLGWNQGTYFGRIQMPSVVDFAFTSPNCISFPDNGNTQSIELLDRNFINSEFRDLNISDRHFDFITVARAIKLKNLPAFMKSVKKLYTEGESYKTLLVVPKSENENPDKYDTDIVDLYNDLFTEEERNNITLLRLSGELGFLGIPPETLNWLYNNTKVLYIGSDSEGGCRVVHEALLAGCDVVYWKDHRGPLKDYLNETNSVAFDSYDTIDVALKESINNYKYYEGKGSQYNELLSETHSIEKLTPHFEELYTRHNQKFDGKLINCNKLANRLPAHHLDVEWHDDEFPTADILSVSRLTKFINYLNEHLR